MTGQYADGTAFSQTTNSSGYVTLTGAPGTWSFAAASAGYQTNTWNESITATETLNAYVTQNQAVTLTLYVHSGSSSGPLLSGVQVTGQYADGTAFSQTTNRAGT